MNKKYFIGLQLLFIALVLIAIYFFYPKVDVNLNGNSVIFDSINTDVVMISKNSDFSNPKYINFDEFDKLNFELDPGVYYFKPANGLIKGFSQDFVVESVVGLDIEEFELVNIGNVKLRIEKEVDGKVVGKMTLEPDESKDIEDNLDRYTGGLEDEV
jgi:hypothetical protein